MKLYEPIDHTADAGFRVFGASPAALFENAARCLCEAIGEIEGVGHEHEERIALEAADLPALLRAWLSEVLYLSYVKHLVLAHARVEGIAGGRLSATLAGERYDEAHHERHPEIKAVTWHELAVTQVGDHWEAVFILDL